MEPCHIMDRATSQTGGVLHLSYESERKGGQKGEGVRSQKQGARWGSRGGHLRGQWWLLKMLHGGRKLVAGVTNLIHRQPIGVRTGHKYNDWGADGTQI